MESRSSHEGGITMVSQAPSISGISTKGLLFASSLTDGLQAPKIDLDVIQQLLWGNDHGDARKKWDVVRHINTP
jgi:hypothetical protein